MKKYFKYFLAIFILVLFTSCASRPPTIYEYAKQNNLNGVINASKTQAIDAVNQNKYTALHRACDNGNLAMVKYLVEKGANIEAKTIHGDTPLIRASYKGHLNVVNYLISNGANVDAQSNGGITPLITATGYGRYSIVKALVEGGANIEFVTKKGNSAVKNARKYNKTTIVNYLEKSLENKKAKNKQEKQLAVKKQKELEEDKQIAIVNSYLEKNDFDGLKKYTDKNPNTVYFIQDKTIRLMLTGPKGLKVGDIRKLIKKGRSERIITSLIKRVKTPYKEFDLEEIDILIDDMDLSDNIVATMIDVTTQLLKDQQKRKEQEYYLAEQKRIAQQAKTQIVKERVIERQVVNQNQNSGGNELMNAVGKEVGKELGKQLLDSLF